jgi:hypothetical protein
MTWLVTGRLLDSQLGEIVSRAQRFDSFYVAVELIEEANYFKSHLYVLEVVNFPHNEFVKD